MMKAGWSGRRRACVPVYIVAPLLLCGENENFAHLRRSVDLARVARYPWRTHRLFGDALELRGSDPDFLQAARHAERADETVEHVAGVLAGLSHRGGHQRLALGVLRLVPAHHRRQHHARSIAVRHVIDSAEYVTDAMARAHGNAGRERAHREPGADLAVHPR